MPYSNDSSPEFDVLMPIYIGDELEIARSSIRSVLDNTLQPKRFTIVKDGPVCQELESYLSELRELHPSIHICGTPSNQGLGPALNFGISHCISDVVIRCDADDFNHPDRFASQLHDLCATKADILGSQVYELDPESGQKRLKSVPVEESKIRSFAEWRNPVNHMTVAFKRRSILRVGGYPNLPFKEDYGLWLIALSEGLKIRNSERVLVTARAGESMIKRRSNATAVRSELDLFRLKWRLQTSTNAKALIVLAFRVTSLVMPLGIVKSVYRFLRQRKN